SKGNGRSLSTDLSRKRTRACPFQACSTFAALRRSSQLDNFRRLDRCDREPACRLSFGAKLTVVLEQGVCAVPGFECRLIRILRQRQTVGTKAVTQSVELHVHF